MHCPRCNADLPNESAFCPQCGNQEMRSPIFQPDPQMPRRSNTGLYFLVGCTGCGIVFVSCWLLSFFFLGVFIAYVEHTSLVEKPIVLVGQDGSEITIGSDFPLYGKTLDDEDFDWESLRGKYVLVKFTATWCGPCAAAIPEMLEAYEKYHDKGFEIVSVYILEDEWDAVATVRRFVEQEKLPWVILSESLTIKGGQPSQRATFGIQRVPTKVLVDKEGKIIGFDDDYKRELRKLLVEE